VLNFFVFQLFLIYVHYMLETSERRLYTLRDQLKIQCRATQKAQVAERKAGESKRRLTSCVFFLVRCGGTDFAGCDVCARVCRCVETGGRVPRLG
jgi:hypothetical protein